MEGTANDFLKDIKQLDFTDRYIKEEFPKKQIVLHHTVSNGSAQAIVNYWKTLPTKVGVCMIIERDGTINQLFSSKYYGGHLGLHSEDFTKIGLPYIDLNKNSIAIEIISWGGLTLKDGKYYNAYNKEVINEPITEFKDAYRGYKYFHSYTKEQLESVKKLLLYWGNLYNIPLDYIPTMWDINKDAMTGKEGVYTHTSFRTDKSDCFPQVEMIDMLKSLTIK
jgi:N-acetyl-anhydromuramyl-L-alanine amidase AmpD